MRLLTAVLLLLSLCACGSNADDEPISPPEDSAEVAARKAAYQREQARLAAVKYPECKKVWDGEKLSACGAEVLRVALQACQSMSGGSGAAWIDEYTGDSWQIRAGSAAVSIADRDERMRRAHGPPYMETFAYALGNGSTDVGRVLCELSPEMRLVSII